MHAYVFAKNIMLFLTNLYHRVMRLIYSPEIRKQLRAVRLLIKAKYYHQFYPSAPIGSKEWLIGTELKYSGGHKVHAPPYKRSSLSTRNKPLSRVNPMVGADRMLHHNYAISYHEFLKPFFINDSPYTPTICEFGILKGTGLAIWCDLFPTSRCLGFDIDLQHIYGNLPYLRALGAFTSSKPELYECDQFKLCAAYLEQILHGDKIDICFDDGCHEDEAILTTFKSVLPHLNSNFVYFIEDNRTVHRKLHQKYSQFTITSRRELTIITP